MKTYVLIVSSKFPKIHKRAGAQTGFIQAILQKKKKHTIRNNYELWKRRIDEVNEGNACISIRIWKGKPYHSKQVHLIRLFKGEVGVQMLHKFTDDYWVDGETPVDEVDLATNDSLNLPDFQDWFKDASGDLAIIHFTKFRY